MTATGAPALATPVTAVDAAVGRAVTRLAVRHVLRGALIVTGVIVGMSAVTVEVYRSTADTLDATAVDALARNPAIRTLFGEPVALDQVGGFLVWRTGTPVAVLLGVWGLLTATRITRGEEDSGRWDLLLAGRLPVTAVVVRHLAVLAAVMPVVGAGVTGVLLIAGAGGTGAVLYGAGVALVGVFFVAAGGLAAQVVSSRGAASMAAAALVGVGLLLRVVADGVGALAWLRWLSPFGLTALTQPYGDGRVLPLAVLAAASVLLWVAVPVAAGHRDVRGGLLPESVSRAPRLALLGSVFGFATRRTVVPVVAWCLGVGGYFLLVGLLAVSMRDFLTDNPRFAELAARAGFAEMGTMTGYAAALFALLAVPVGLFTVVHLGTVAAEETARRYTLLYAQPVTRLRMLAAETGAALGGAVVLTTVAGLAAWAGTATVDARLGLTAALSGAWNLLPVGLLSLGASVFALGWAPRAVGGIGALPTAGGFLLHVVAETASTPEWIGNLSPFAHVALVPHEPANWPASAVMIAVTALLTAVGAVGYRRRDLTG